MYVNTRSLRDRTKAGALEEKADTMLEHYLPLADRISRAVLRHLRSGSKPSASEGQKLC